MRCVVYCGVSIDGYIADRDGGLDWLDSVPNPDHDDMGWSAFMAGIDVLVMGRKTFETVCAFDGDWPYTKPVCVLSESLSTLPAGYEDKAFLLRGAPEAIQQDLADRGYGHCYIDGGQCIQRYLQADLIDEMILSTLPLLLGGGIPLFGEHAKALSFEHVKTDIVLGAIVQTHYRRVRQ